MSTRLLAPRNTRQRILDAAGVVLARYGMRKTTMDDVARQASCSRAGLYKHFPTKDVLLQAFFLREVELFLDALRGRAEHSRGPRLLEDAFVFAVRYVREHPVARRVIETEPQVFVAAFTRADEGLGEVAVEATASLVGILMGRADIRKTDPRAVAELLLRLLVSFVLVPKLAEVADEEGSMRRMFREVVMKGIGKK